MGEEIETVEEEAEIEIPKTVRVGNREVTLVLPKSQSVRFDVAVYHQKNSTRAITAALGLCWGGMGRPKAKFEDSYNVGQYGGEVFDELIGRGVSPAEIATAGSLAYVKIARSLPQILEKIHNRKGEVIAQIDEVDKAEGN